MAFVDAYGPWAVVTGASSGIGREMAIDLASRGLNIAVIARRTKRLEALAGELEAAHGIETRVVTADLATDDGVQRVAALADELPVGLLVNNAGISAPFVPFHELPLETISQMSRLNMLAPATLMHVYLKPMLARRRGGIINVASTAAYQPMPLMANYAATKAYLLNLGDAVAQEVASHGIDLVTLCPGPTETEIVGHVGLDTDGAMQKMLMPADRVARQAIDALGRRRIVIPGLTNKVSAIMAQRLVPRGWITRMIHATLRRTLAKDAGDAS
ncbi:MAG: SDR family oxidoreductase [Candidatus Dadabacteria bacterium]|nr:MAG: SDR family oxidoreductase [Candidatus Dadabacteria bacterium]